MYSILHFEGISEWTAKLPPCYKGNSKNELNDDTEEIMAVKEGTLTMLIEEKMKRACLMTYNLTYVQNN
ncbi:hypothetical protein HUJ04_007051 [Dendroctonus ponderosae]|nr:hypothetical protein HUJ04_007051 [Dendroctonus ponderosae]